MIRSPSFRWFLSREPLKSPSPGSGSLTPDRTTGMGRSCPSDAGDRAGGAASGLPGEERTKFDRVQPFVGQPVEPEGDDGGRRGVEGERALGPDLDDAPGQVAQKGVHAKGGPGGRGPELDRRAE